MFLHLSPRPHMMLSDSPDLLELSLTPLSKAQTLELVKVTMKLPQVLSQVLSQVVDILELSLTPLSKELTLELVKVTMKVPQVVITGGGCYLLQVTMGIRSLLRS